MMEIKIWLTAIYAILDQEIPLPNKGGAQFVYSDITVRGAGLGVITPSEKTMGSTTNISGKQILEFASKWWHIPVIIAILWYGIDARLHRYGNLGLSIGTNDTASYLRTSQAPFFSKRLLLGERSITIPILYKLLSSNDGSELRLVSLPGEANQIQFLCAENNFVLLVNDQYVDSARADASASGDVA